MKRCILSICCLVFSVLFFGAGPAWGEDGQPAVSDSQQITFFHPSGVNGFIVYDMDPAHSMEGLSYGKQSYDLSAHLGLPLTVDVERIKIGEGSLNADKFLDASESDYLEIFSIPRSLAYGPKHSRFAYNGSLSNISMVVATAKYQATEKFSANLSTGLSQTVEEKNGVSTSNVGYEVDIAGHYEIAPGLGFSVGAGYATSIDSLTDPITPQKNKLSWSLISKFHLKF
ncbi:MAG: hypothetical protein GXP58_04530 [Deltaproteobacteria bacterium]|nr:hypothetical protein [Deltaproteobacteria bacterium]